MLPETSLLPDWPRSNPGCLHVALAYGQLMHSAGGLGLGSRASFLGKKTHKKEKKKKIKGWLIFFNKKKRKKIKKNLNCLCTKLVTWTLHSWRRCDVLDVLTHIDRAVDVPQGLCWDLWVKEHFTVIFYFIGCFVGFFVFWFFFPSFGVVYFSGGGYFFPDVNLSLPPPAPAAAVFSSSGMYSLHWKTREYKTNKKQNKRESFFPSWWDMQNSVGVCIYKYIYNIYKYI